MNNDKTQNDTQGLASLPHYTNLQFNSLPGWARDLILALEQRAAAPALAASHAKLVAAVEMAFDEQNRQGWLSLECWDVCRQALTTARQLTQGGGK